MKGIISIIAIFVHVFCFAQGRIQGKVTDLNTGAPLKGTRITLSRLDSVIFDPENIDSIRLICSHFDTRYDSIYTILKTVTTDSGGYYVFDSVAPNYYEIFATHRTKELRPGRFETEVDVVRGLKIVDKCEVNKSFILHVTCEFESTRNYTYCPRCKKKDKVLLIQYGMLMPFVKEEPGYYYNGYCDVPRCHPTKRCMRCELEF